MSKIKKVLMLTHPEMDYLAYMMFDGLYKILGKDNLNIYPYVRHYQKGIDDWYILDDEKKGYTSSPECICHHETPEKSFEELVNKIHSFDIIYLSSGRTYAVNALDQFIKKCGRKNLPPLIFSEGEDYHELITVRDIKKRYDPVVCFKREIMEVDWYNNQDLHPLYPLPFSAITDKLPPDNPNKDIDVFASFGNTHPQRENIVRLINSSHLPGKYNIQVGIDHVDHGSIPTSRYTYLDYLGKISRSKINIVSRGHGYDTVRRFEAPCFSGLVLSDNIPLMTPDNFIDNVHLRYYNSNLSDLIQLIEHYLINQMNTERIGKAGREHCMKYHTIEARTRYFLDKVEGHI